MGVNIRTAAPADEPAIIDLLATAMHRDDDGRYRSLHRWKHDENAFGASPRWVAVDDDDSVIGVRLFMRWRFRTSSRTWSAVQAVDTATHPGHQGRGIFRSLTMHAVDQLRAEGVDLIFNTPNANSRPGYLRMGWVDAGQLTPTFRLRPSRAITFLRGLGAASLWTEPSTFGSPAAEAFEDEKQWRSLLEREHATTALATDRSLDFLRWRYGSPLLAYRVKSTIGAAVVFRMRQRGELLEATICDLFGDDRAAHRRLIRAIRAETGADVSMYIGPERGLGLFRYPGGGRRLAYRPLTDEPDLREPSWALTMGDVEIF